jgi:hypothetical protein
MSAKERCCTPESSSLTSRQFETKLSSGTKHGSGTNYGRHRSFLSTIPSIRGIRVIRGEIDCASMGSLLLDLALLHSVSTTDNTDGSDEMRGDGPTAAGPLVADVSGVVASILAGGSLGTALHCTALHCTALHCTALHCYGRGIC